MITHTGAFKRERQTAPLHATVTKLCRGRESSGEIATTETSFWVDRPLLLIDVDGVISLFGFDHAAPPPDGRYMLVDGIAHFLSGTAGGHLRRLEPAFELAWCTGWEEKANEYLPPALGLPGPLAYVEFDHDRPAAPGALEARRHRPSRASVQTAGVDRRRA